MCVNCCKVTCGAELQAEYLFSAAQHVKCFDDLDFADVLNSLVSDQRYTARHHSSAAQGNKYTNKYNMYYNII